MALLSKHPTPTAARAVLELSTAEDRLDIRGCELFWLPSGGLKESELDLKRIAAELGPMTIRTREYPGALSRQVSQLGPGVGEEAPKVAIMHLECTIATQIGAAHSTPRHCSASCNLVLAVQTVAAAATRWRK